MNLVIDIGNSLKKAGIFEKGKLTALFDFKEDVKTILEKTIYKKAIISSVAEVPGVLENNPQKPVVILKGDTAIPFKNAYKTPLSLGTDRLAAVAGAYTLYKSHNVLVFDAGTCITSDFIDNKGIYHGGSISPGIKMRFKALNSFTSRLPLVDPELPPIELNGSTTKESILSGVINGTVAEIDGRIRMYKEQYPDLKVLVSGGDSLFFESSLKESIFAVPELVLIGLNTILEYNVP